MVIWPQGQLAFGCHTILPRGIFDIPDYQKSLKVRSNPWGFELTGCSLGETFWLLISCCLLNAHQVPTLHIICGVTTDNWLHCMCLVNRGTLLIIWHVFFIQGWISKMSFQWFITHLDNHFSTSRVLKLQSSNISFYGDIKHFQQVFLKPELFFTVSPLLQWVCLFLSSCFDYNALPMFRILKFLDFNHFFSFLLMT